MPNAGGGNSQSLVRASIMALGCDLESAMSVHAGPSSQDRRSGGGRGLAMAARGQGSSLEAGVMLGCAQFVMTVAAC